MSNLTTALIVILCMNAMLFLGQYAVNSIGGSSVFYDETTGLCIEYNR